MEVVIALGLFAFALLTMAALLPTGIHSNKVSVQETSAVGILTLLEADLRNTHPSLNSGKSGIFGLTLPYTLNGGNYMENAALTANTLAPGYTTGVGADGSVSLVTAKPTPQYQATVIYTVVPPSASLAPVEAHLIVNWPCISTATVSDLTNPAKVTGFVDTYVAFPSP